MCLVALKPMKMDVARVFIDPLSFILLLICIDDPDPYPIRKKYVFVFYFHVFSIILHNP